MMSDRLQDLIIEIDKVVKAPYAVCLKPLNNLLQKTDPRVIRRWQVLKACQIPRLAALTVECLTNSSSALSILAIFSHLPQFRDEVLVQQPNLMESLMELTNSHDSIQYAEACIALLSSPFMHDTAIPKSLSGFLQTLLCEIEENLCSSRICALKNLISSFSATIFELVEENVLDRTIDLFQLILKGKDNHLQTLTCITILGNIYTDYFANPAVYNSSASGNTSPLLLTWATKASSFFTKGPKTNANILQTILRTIMYCSVKADRPHTENVEALHLASQILDYISPEVLSQWTANNSEIVGKLLNKLRHPELPMTLRYLGSAVFSAESLQFKRPISDLLKLLISGLIDPSDENPLDYVREPLKLVISILQPLQEELAPDLQSHCIEVYKVYYHQIVTFIIEQCRPDLHPNYNRAVSLRHAVFLTEAFKSVAARPSTGPFFNALMSAVHNIDFPEWWNLVLNARGQGQSCSQLGVCPDEIEQRRLDLAFSFSTMLIQLASTTSELLNQKNFEGLLSIVIHARPTSQFGCVYTQTNFQSLTHNRNRDKVPKHDTGVVWLKNNGSNRSHLPNENKIITLSETDGCCTDLRDLCDNLKNLLRKAGVDANQMQMRFYESESALSESKVCIERLELKLKANEEQGALLSIGKDQLLSKIDVLSNENQLLEKTTANLLQQIASERTKMELNLHELELDSRIKIMAVEEMLAVQNKQNSQLQANSSWLYEQIRHLQSEMGHSAEADFVQIKQVYYSDLEVISRERDCLKATIQEKNKEVGRLNKIATEFSRRLIEQKETMNAFIISQQEWATSKKKLEDQLDRAEMKKQQLLESIRKYSDG